MKKLNLLLLVSMLAMTAGIVTTTSCSKSSSSPAKDSVLHSSWITLKMINQGVDNDPSSPTYGYTIFAQEISAPAITQSIMNNGLILTYIQGVNGSGDTTILNAEGLLSEFFYKGRIELSSVGVDYSGLKYRYVIVPGNILTNKYPGTPVRQLRSMPYSGSLKL